MPLDPYVESLLKTLESAGRPKIWEVTPEQARQGMLALARLVDAKDEPIGRVDDLAIPGPGGPLPARVYTPVDAPAPEFPGIVYFHGGGFVLGDLETHEGMCRMLANASGCRVVSVAYRLAPEAPFPAAVDDGMAAVRWVAAHARVVGVDPGRLAVGGDSAGGNLAAVVCQLARAAGGPEIALQLLFCPRTASDFETESHRALALGYFLERPGMDWFASHYAPDGSADPKDPRLAPLEAADVSGLPPLHLHTAEYDPLRDEGHAYAERLRRAGVPVSVTCHAGMIHHFYGLGGAIPYARTAVAKAGAAVKAALCGTADCESTETASAQS